MSLPKIQYQTFEENQPSSKAKINFRPFVTREEKILLTASQSEDKSEIISAIKQVIHNCDVGNVLDVEKLPSCDVEYFFLRLRARSVNNIITLIYVDSEDNKEYKVNFDLNNIHVHHGNDSPFVKIKDRFSLRLRYMTIDETIELDRLAKEDLGQAAFRLCKLSIVEAVLPEGEIELLEDYTDAEVQDFIENLPVEALEAIQKFHDNRPVISCQASYKTAQGTLRELELKGLDDFFSLE